MKGYIGHEVSQRQAIEFFFDKRTRRLKGGHKTHLRDLHLLSELNTILESYTEAILLNSYDESLACSPIECYNAQSHKAIALHEYELSALLLPAEKRIVGKEGVSFGGFKWVYPLMFDHHKIFITQNINNLYQSFVFDEQMQFLGEAIIKDKNDPLIAEMAKQANKIHQKRLRVIKKGHEAERELKEKEMVDSIFEIAKSAPKLKTPKIKPLNSVMEREVRIKNAQKNANTDFLPQKTTQEKKKDYSWEACVLKKA